MLKTLQIVGNARYGGATYLMLAWSRYLLERRCDVHILCTDEVMKNEVADLSGARLIDSIFVPREISPFTDLKAFIQLIRLLRHEEYDVVHTYTATPSFLGRLASWLCRVPVVVNHQGGWSVGEDSSLVERLFFTPLEYLAILASTKNICVSHAEAALAKKLRIAPKQKLTTIVNGMDAEPFVTATQNGSGDKLREAFGIPADCLVIGSTSRLVSGKGNEDLLHAVALLKDTLADRPILLLLAGDGRDRDDLNKLAVMLGIQEHVRFLGFWEEIPTFLAAIDIFVTATLSEGLSISLLEAMAAACPIVATSIPPNAEVIVNEQSGLLVPTESPFEIAKAILELAIDDSLAKQYGVAARKRVQAHYTLERMFNETWDLYIELLRQKQPERDLQSTLLDVC